VEYLNLSVIAEIAAKELPFHLILLARLLNAPIAKVRRNFIHPQKKPANSKAARASIVAENLNLMPIVFLKKTV